MSDRRRLGISAIVLAVFGLGSLVSMVSNHRLAAIRSVDMVQLIGVGMCFGAALFAFVRFAGGPRS
jgi:hypothetical protein